MRVSKTPRLKTKRQSFLSKFKARLESTYGSFLKPFRFVHSGLEQFWSVVSDTIGQSFALSKSFRSNLLSSLIHWFVPHLPKLNNHFSFQYTTALPLLVPLSVALGLVILKANALTLTFAFVLLGFSVLYLFAVVETNLYKYLVLNILGLCLTLFAYHLSLTLSVWYGFTVLAVLRPLWFSGLVLYYLTSNGLLPLYIFVCILLVWFVSLLLDVTELLSRR